MKPIDLDDDPLDDSTPLSLVEILKGIRGYPIVEEAELAEEDYL